MTNPTNADVRRFLEQFFGTGNKFGLEQIERDGGKFTKIRPWVELLTQAEPLPTVLPCCREGGVDWYGIAQSDRQLRRLSEELMAFVGPTYSTFRGQRAQLNLQDPVESAVYEFTGGAAIKFCGHDSDGRATAVWEALERMRRVSARRVKRIAEFPRATGRVLRDFYMALQAGDRPSAFELTPIPARPASPGCAESPKKVDWVLDLLDVLVLYPCPSQEKRSQLLFAAANKFGQFSGRGSASMLRIIRSYLKQFCHQGKVIQQAENSR